MSPMKLPSFNIFRTVESKGFVTLLTGNALVSLISLVFYPILTRLYNPGEFGIFASFMVVMSFISLGSSLQLHSFLPIPPSDDEAKQLFQNSLGLLTLSSLVVAVTVLLVYMSDFEVVIKGHDISGILVFLPVYSFLFGFNEILKANNIRRKKFFINAKATNFNRVCANSLKVGFSFVIKSVGLIAGDIFGLILSAYIYTKNSPAFLVRPTLRINFIKAYLKRGAFSTYSATLNQLIVDLPMVFMGTMFSIELMGAFLVSYKVILQPSLILGSSLAGAVFRKMNEIDPSSGELGKYFFSVTKKVMMFLAPLCLCFSLIAEDSFIWLLGQDWESAGQFAKYFVLLVPFKVLSALTFNLLLTINRVSFLAIKKTFNIALITLIFAILESVENILLWMVVGEGLISAVFAIIGLKLSKGTTVKGEN